MSLDPDIDDIMDWKANHNQNSKKGGVVLVSMVVTHKHKIFMLTMIPNPKDISFNWQIPSHGSSVVTLLVQINKQKNNPLA